MATHSSVLAWRIPGTGEPAGLPSTQLKRLAAAAAADGAGCHDLHFLNVEFYASFFTLPFHFHQEARKFQPLEAFLIPLSVFSPPNFPTELSSYYYS